jgi:hypothetical protein
MYCGKCKGRDLEFALGAYVTDSGQPMHERRRIDFHNGVAVRPERG